jgi:ferredoxin
MAQPRYRAVIDHDLCIGCGLCEETAPDVFQLGEYTASVVDASIQEDQSEPVLIAARDCPVEAISVEPVTGTTDSASPPDEHDEEGEDEEERGEIREYKRKHGDPADGDTVQTNDPERLERREHNLSVIRNGTDDN